MSKKSIIDFSKRQDDRIVLDDGEYQQIAPTVKKIVEDGWTKITLSGSSEMCKSAWFEAKMAGLDVLGYSPTSIDRRKLEDMKLDRKAGGPFIMTGNEVASDYSLKVIPKLHTKYEDLRKKRLQLSISSSKLNYTDVSNPQIAVATSIDEQFFAAKRVLERSMEDLEFFTRLGNKTVTVEQRYEDGIARYTVSQLERDRILGIRNNLSPTKRRAY
jgi:hypothetical protein